MTTTTAEPPLAPAGDGELPEPRHYTIDELSAATGVPSRTIRFYQAKGALPAPVRSGRQAFYDDSHVERLGLVAALQDRGLSLKAIRDLLSHADAGDVSLSEWLGVGESLRAPWSDDRPRIFNEAELTELLGDKPRPGLIAELVRAGLLKQEGHAHPPSYLVHSPGLLRISLKLDQTGVDLSSVVKTEQILRRRLSRAADELVAYFEQQARSDGSSPQELARSLDALRSAGMDAVKLIFAQEMERTLRALVEEGRAVSLRRRKR